MHWYGDDPSGWGYALMTVGMVLFWALVILGAIALVRTWPRTREIHETAPAPEQVLAVRFARGEIDEVEYHTRLDVLRAEGNSVRGRSTLGTAPTSDQRGT